MQILTHAAYAVGAHTLPQSQPFGYSPCSVKATAPQPTPAHDAPAASPRSRALIERSFPCIELSHESYKERRAGATQTLTRLGKWWGRKPLILVRAALLGALLPATNDPRQDHAILLKLLHLDEDGLRRRRFGSIPLRTMLPYLTSAERETHLDAGADGGAPRFRSDCSRTARQQLQQRVFDRLPRAEMLRHCRRPEHAAELSNEEWRTINAHLGTTANSLTTLVEQLGQRRFSHRPRVGDAFCGGGSIPFEAARIGCDVYASDLSPVAALQTWTAIHVLGGDSDRAQRVRAAQQDVLSRVDARITALGTEHNVTGDRAEYFLYCTEVTCPACAWSVPLAPSWLISQSHGAVAELCADSAAQRYALHIRTGCDADHQKAARMGTFRRQNVVCPHCRESTPITAFRGDALRQWERTDVAPHNHDTLRERLYCIRWLTADGRVEFRTPTVDDHARETLVRDALAARFDAYQSAGFIPRRRIDAGVETTRLGRERGWTHWHHLFHPRQLLLHGLLHEAAARYVDDPPVYASLLLGIASCANWNARLCVWNPDRSKGPGSTEQTFLNLALNTLNNYGCRGLNTIRDTFAIRIDGRTPCRPAAVRPADARTPGPPADLWITDPPYADAVNYHELSEFLLGWLEGRLRHVSPDWYTDSRRKLAVRQTGDAFRDAMIACYRNLAARMPDDGLQIVLFTHHDPGVWADLALVLRAAGLWVTASWCVRTESDSAGYKRGNYVQDTVLLVLRKAPPRPAIPLDAARAALVAEVRHATRNDTLDFDAVHQGDARLAAYAAALKVLTRQPISGIDAQSGDHLAAIRALIDNALRPEQT